ncbi:DNA primase [Salmonella enterica]|nr:DNA primase [Salmonella enterica subsp. enterica serovar Norwich]EAO6094628.1 DNA primase [Salmonella enterica]ECS6114556.1 DNA primase [Salmonella enterica subsp. enterica serovar Sandiego]ECU0059894.1 DNA primase [Salmonella enterica subsp. enterica serovar Panama]EDL7723272.1 DNA primase [Salmonella enterica subsp. enterica serovar Give]EDO3741025.1 DNA primase [Salmonella enterica subsp. enterica serovar 4,[5],12:r:-]EEC0982970.1 DNA primase [Salmonella enterica subsp. enterica]EJK827
MPENKSWGATPDEWFHFDLVLGRTDQLLPVVCNPGAAISPDSKLKALGKTPSRYNRDRQVTGISHWTEHIVTEHDFARWSKEPDYGICVRTGHGWLALDCDSEDEDIQADIRKTLVQLLGELPPRRWRANSNKCLYLLAVDGDFRKRIHRLAGDMGIIELLANGQQFVACGTHSSGARIEWDGGLPDEPPVITTDQFETLWQRLADQLPVSVTTEAGSTKMRDRSTFTPGATDETANYLDANGWTLLDGANGERYIRCPFEDGHSTSGDPTSTVYFPGGTAGFEQGHFKCLHASCAHRDDGDFLNAIGIRNDDFEDLTADEEGDKPEFVDINTDMTSHFLERFIYVIEGDQVCDLSRPPYQCMMDMKSFKNLMAPYQFPPEGKGQPVPATKRWIEHRHKKIAETTGYKPGSGRIIERFDGRYEINEFYMPEHPRTADTSKVSTFLNHMAYLVPDAWQREFFIARLGWMVQRPERRCPISILHVATAHGTGRGWVSQLMERVLGPWNCARTRMKILCDNQFHDYLYNTLLCTIDEVRENDKRYEVNDKIRDVLTEPRFEVNRKYGSKKTMDIYTGFLFYTNHFDALALPEEDRRIAVLGGPDFAASEEHYASLYGALSDSDFIAQVYWYLMGVDLSRFNWQRAPETKERLLMIESNKSDVESALIEILNNPPAPAMTYQQIVNAILAEAGMDVEINQKHITRVLKERTKREPVRVKIDGFVYRIWILVKDNEFSNEELREIYKSCEILQSGL